MKLKIYQIDAFASKAFEGNPAAVVPLEAWIEDEVMQQIAMENNLSPTSTPKSQQTPKLWASVTPITAKIDLPVPHLLLYI